MTGRNIWVRIAYCRDIPTREGRAVKVDNREIAIFVEQHDRAALGVDGGENAGKGSAVAGRDGERL